MKSLGEAAPQITHIKVSSIAWGEPDNRVAV